MSYQSALTVADPDSCAVLSGRRIQLELLAQQHFAALYRNSRYPKLWRYLPGPFPSTLEEFEKWFNMACAARGDQRAFAICLLPGREAVGSTRFLDIRPEHKRLEIGWTWLRPDLHGTGINIETKLLLLDHAFNVGGIMRVQFRTDSENRRSCAALEKLGAAAEGTLRDNMVRPDGTIRSTRYYSILSREWPEQRERILRRLLKDTGVSPDQLFPRK